MQDPAGSSAGHEATSNVDHLLVVTAGDDTHGWLAQQLAAAGLVTSLDRAADGAEALELIGRSAYGCVILDAVIAMTRIGDLTVLQRIRQEHDASQLPVLIAAARLDAETKREVFRQGASDYVQRCDEARDELVARIRSSIALSRAVRSVASTRQLHEKNLELQADYADLYENAVDMYASVDVHTAIVQRCNETMARKTGYAKEEIVGKPLFYLYHPDCMDQVREAFEIFQATGVVRNMELVVQRKDGSTMDVLLGVEAHRDADGNIDHSRSTWRDISERRAAQRALVDLNADLENQVHIRTAQLRRTNADLQQFAYAASHDLQEPLRAISGYSQLLAKHYQDDLDERASAYLANVVNGTERMQTLIAGMLAYTRIGSRGGRFETVACDAALDKALGLLAATIEESAAEVTRDAPLPTIEVARNQLIQLFRHLIGNAIKFCDGRAPRIHITARPLESSAGDYPPVSPPAVPLPDDGWLFSIEDNGIGIDAEYIDRIFEMFGRLHSRDRYKGTGLGLAICKRIVERHGGAIWATSRPGSGSTFFFVIPARPSADPTFRRSREWVAESLGESLTS